MKRWYDKEEDILNIQLSDGAYWKSIELNGVVFDIDAAGSIISIEVLEASKVFFDVRLVIDSVSS